MWASAGREQMLTGTLGKVAFVFPHFHLNRISDQGYKHWFAFCWNSAFTFRFSSMILSLGAFHLSFPVCSTCLSQSASVSATECYHWNPDYPPDGSQQSHLILFWIWPGVWKGLDWRSVASYTGLVPWSTRWRVHGVLWDTGSVYGRLEIVQLSSET